MSSIIPEVAVSNMAQSLEFYSVIGFNKDADGIIDENGSQWSSLTMGDAALWLTRQDVVPELSQGDPRGNGVTIYITVDDIDTLYGKLSNAGLQPNIVKEIETMWYGLRQFTLADPDGYILTLNQRVAQEGDAGESSGEAATEG